MNTILSLHVLLTWVQLTAALNGHFLMIGDMHLDFTYGKGSQSCNQGVKDEDLKPYGDYECDPPFKLVEAAVTKLNEIAETNNVDFIVWMGDTPGHMNRDQAWTKELFFESMQNGTDILSRTLSPGKVLLPVIGNHDYFPTNQLPGNHSEIYERIGEMWKDWLPGDTLTDFKNGGYYTIPLSTTAPKLRAIVLNTNMYSPSDAATENQADPGGQFQWLEAELLKAVNGNEKIHLIFHLPTGPVDIIRDDFFLRKEQNTKLNSIIRKYSSDNNSVIIGVYATHVHTDSFKMYYGDDSETPAAALFVSPSVSPWRWPGSEFANARNPSIRMFDFDSSQLHLTDIKQYYLELPKANDGSDTSWKLEYSFQSSFGVADIKPASLHQVLMKFKQTGSPEFDKFVKYHVVSLKPEDSEAYDGTCDDNCKWKHLCSIEFIDADPYNECIDKNCPNCDMPAKAQKSNISKTLFNLVLALICSWIMY